MRDKLLLGVTAHHPYCQHTQESCCTAAAWAACRRLWVHLVQAERCQLKACHCPNLCSLLKVAVQSALCLCHAADQQQQVFHHLWGHPDPFFSAARHGPPVSSWCCITMSAICPAPARQRQCTWACIAVPGSGKAPPVSQSGVLATLVSGVRGCYLLRQSGSEARACWQSYSSHNILMSHALAAGGSFLYFQHA